MNSQTDRIIELALVVFEYDPVSGLIARVLDSYEGLEDPGFPIPPESTAVHGITDEMVAGRSLDENRIQQILEGACLVVAHNARFDRQFLERRLSVFSTLPWGCSYTQVPWNAEGVPSAKLEYLAIHYGYFYDAHRSQADCLALLEILRHPLPRSGIPGFAALLKSIAEPAYRLWATNSPYESKDSLKARGYRWDQERRCWHRTVTKETAKEEAEWLKAEVFGGQPRQIEVEILDPMTNFSDRPGRRTKRPL